MRLPWDEFARRVGEATGFSIQVAQGASSLEKAELIIVGGGNTFQLLRECRARGMLEVIRERVKNGCRYLGWSEALGLIAFQINPHYVSVSLPGHHGETRDERLEEFAQANPGLPVIGLPEGDWIRVSDKSIALRGPHRAMWFESGRPPAPIEAGPIFGDTQ